VLAVVLACTDAALGQAVVTDERIPSPCPLVDEGGELFDAATFLVFGAVIVGPILNEPTWQVVLHARTSRRRADPDERGLRLRDRVATVDGVPHVTSPPCGAPRSRRGLRATVVLQHLATSGLR